MMIDLSKGLLYFSGNWLEIDGKTWFGRWELNTSHGKCDMSFVIDESNAFCKIRKRHITSDLSVGSFHRIIGEHGNIRIEGDVIVKRWDIDLIASPHIRSSESNILKRKFEFQIINIKANKIH